MLSLVADELISIGRIIMTRELAYALYASISSDTGRFSYSNTSPDTHRIAANLIDIGIDFSDINHRLFSSKSLGEIKAEMLVATELKTLVDGKIAYSYVTIEKRESHGLLESDFDAAIDVVRSLRGVEIALFVRETAPGKFKASMRSTGCL